MKYSKILLCMVALVTIGSGGDYLSPSMGQMYPTDWLEGGYVRSFDRSMLMDPGIAGMVWWLDQPVSSFPWYSSDLAFYKQAVPDTTFLPFREYYTITGAPAVGGIISNPTKFDIAQKEPSSVYYGAGVGLPYSQYAATVPSMTNGLWIRGATNWTQYVVSPAGTWLQLIAYTPIAGPAGFYETIQTDTTSSKYNIYQFNQGYNTMYFKADQVGRYMLYFVLNNQPSDVVVVDVLARAVQ